MPTQATLESVSVPNEVREHIIRKVESGDISRKRLAHSIGISEPTFYKIIGKKGARVSTKTMELLQKFEGEKQSPKQEKNAFTPDSVMGKHFNRRETAIKVLDAVSAVLRSEMDAENKIFAATRIIGEESN